jgi:hypothetical protein
MKDYDDIQRRIEQINKQLLELQAKKLEEGIQFVEENGGDLQQI